MSDNIVIRLRQLSDSTGMFGIYRVELTEAADEIERLRAELHMAKKWRDNYKLAFEKSQGKDLNDD